jgi:hypothetical protein
VREGARLGRRGPHRPLCYPAISPCPRRSIPARRQRGWCSYRRGLDVGRGSLRILDEDAHVPPPWKSEVFPTVDTSRQYTQGSHCSSISARNASPGKARRTSKLHLPSNNPSQRGKTHSGTDGFAVAGSTYTRTDSGSIGNELIARIVDAERALADLRSALASTRIRRFLDKNRGMSVPDRRTFAESQCSRWETTPAAAFYAKLPHLASAPLTPLTPRVLFFSSDQLEEEVHTVVSVVSA